MTIIKSPVLEVIIIFVIKALVVRRNELIVGRKEKALCQK